MSIELFFSIKHFAFLNSNEQHSNSLCLLLYDTVVALLLSDQGIHLLNLVLQGP